MESLLKGTTPGFITEVFFWLIIVSLLFAIWFRKTGKFPSYVNYSATLLTSLGILGTFIGIVIGLLDFNAEDIDGSIGSLLAGLKTAFITSLVGMAASIIFKLLEAIPLFVKDERIDLQDVGAEDLYRAINDQGRLMLESSLVQQGLLTDLKRAIVGGEDDTLVSQVKLLRGDMNDNHKTSKTMDERLAIIQTVSTKQQQTFQQFSDKLWIRLQDVADTIAKSATEEVIKALNDVITSFNNNLIEQFGDNFKALDESVKKLVVWQGKYGQQVDEMVKQYTLGVSAIKQTETSVANISDKSSQINETMKNLQEVMQVNQEQVETLGGHLGAFKEMRDHAIEAVPVIHKQVKVIVNDIGKAVDTVKVGFVESTADFTKSVKETNERLTGTSDEIGKQTGVIRDHFHSTVTELNANVRDMAAKMANESKALSSTLQDANKQTIADISHVQKIVVDSVERMQKQFENVLEEIFQAQTREVGKTFKALEEEMKNAVGNTGNAVDEQIKNIEDATAEQITNVMNEMGRALSSIAQKFTKDYSKLVNEMSDIIDKKGR
ncbi:methyl-accepting chemotaxis protein [Bathymodiolus platifrons methanotrophic gill symbiont]|uniref:methyl-accepting chemotaxis protein n=1 Tax=Bathymodiolus platifrons methanotrophic gill symbiont TaxID=113268 RepID=UPI001C8EC822|nr:methyl-accepting chemotaxis protein [Bathymodiolus platifrons methanotrophic gill symbiont]